MIDLRGVSFAYGSAPVLRDISLLAPDGAVTVLLGPNGSGKSTLLRLMARLLSAQGEVLIDRRPASAYAPKELARTLAFLPQTRAVPAISVASLVAHGRFPYLGFSRVHTKADDAAVERALQLTSLEGCAQRDLRTLSGGERQKAYLAMLIAQDTQNLLLDEPTTFLDIAYQLELMRILRALRDEGRCVVVVLHDIDQALALCDRAALLHGGRLLFSGGPEEAALLPAVESAFGVRVLRREGIAFERA